MAIYAVGDIQGCLKPLQALLHQVGFKPRHDQLWCAGDIINRGPESLATLRFLKEMGDNCKIVLGNHDLHLLALAYGDARFKKGDTLSDILAAPDSQVLLDWLRHQPLIHHDKGHTMVHAGIPVFWSIDKALSLSEEVSYALIHNRGHFLTHMYGNQPDKWHDDLKGINRLRCITNYLTRMRYCHPDGSLELDNKLAPLNNRSDTLPWFVSRAKVFPDDRIIFGHWASLNGECQLPGFFALDTGCVWGGCLTMLRLDDETLFRYQC